ncbi:hypothetical protein CS542_00980 [Pedobacter sp. IW39]|nr:hypothetical protein CS542_00980 [Pedobacter sp. IW39]
MTFVVINASYKLNLYYFEATMELLATRFMPFTFFSGCGILVKPGQQITMGLKLTILIPVINYLRYSIIQKITLLFSGDGAG